MSDNSVRCEREGCNRRVTRGDSTTCTLLCQLIIEQLDCAERSCGAVDDPSSTDHWLAAVALNDALTEYKRTKSVLYAAARAAGFTSAEWTELQRSARAKQRVRTTGPTS